MLHKIMRHITNKETYVVFFFLQNTYIMFKRETNLDGNSMYTLNTSK